MPKKPTEPFGYIAFRKDGSVSKYQEDLGDEKQIHELIIAQKFAEGLKKKFNCEFQVGECSERDHDFWIKSELGNVQVQATEILTRDYQIPLPFDDYLNGETPYTSFVAKSQFEDLGVDMAKKDGVLLNRIKSKLKKNYGQQAAPVWLLVWTVSSDFIPFWIEGGQARTSEGVMQARDYLAVNGSGIFEEVWFLNLLGAPKRVWPL